MEQIIDTRLHFASFVDNFIAEFSH